MCIDVIAGIAADLFYTEDVVALVGPACTYALDGVARLAGFWNIPIITGKMCVVWCVCV